MKLARAVRAIPVVQSSRNVHVIGEPGFSNQRGASALAVILHGTAVLLRLGKSWDWFVTLDVSDYPLVTQDGKCSSFAVSNLVYQTSPGTVRYDTGIYQGMYSVATN